MSGLTILLLAAGASRRMGGVDKLLEQIDGVALLRRQAMAAVSTGCPVIVALPPRALARLVVLTGLGVAVIEVAQAHLGMGESLKIAAMAAGEPDGLMVMLADMPEITSADLTLLIDAFHARPDHIVRAAAQDGTPGHPVVFPARLFPALTALQGDAGARSVLEGELPLILRLLGTRSTTDLDTPEDWANWRARRSGISD